MVRNGMRITCGRIEDRLGVAGGIVGEALKVYSLLRTASFRIIGATPARCYDQFITRDTGVGCAHCLAFSLVPEAEWKMISCIQPGFRHLDDL